MGEELRDLRGGSIDVFSTRLSIEDAKEREKDVADVSLDCDEVEEEEEFDTDSGMGSDDFDLLEVGGECGTEFCQVGDQTCSVPLELYDLSNLSEVLSLEVWNECFSLDEKLSLCKYLPDMDQASFMRTLKDLLSGSNIYFGNPVCSFFDMLKGGLCEPSVSLRRQGLVFFQRQQYYHFLRKYQNNMASECLRITEVWSYCDGQSLEDKLKFLNDMRKEKRLALENVPSRGFEDDSLGKEENLGEPLWSERDIKVMRSEMRKKGKRHKISMQSNQDAASMDFYFKADRNCGRKKGKLNRNPPVLNINSNGTSFSPGFKWGKGTKRLGKFKEAQSASRQPESEATDHIDLQPSDTYAMETEVMNVEPDPTPPRKRFPLITPTVDCSFMFSVIHLLSAVRIALITPYSEESLGLQHEIQEAQSRTSGDVSNGSHINESIEGGNSGRPEQGSVPTFSIQEIVNRVRINPGDPCILETPEPLLDLVRGVLKIFSSKPAPQGAKGWKPIAKYERSIKSWSWIGPLNRTLSETENMEEVTSPESWGLPHRMLVKLVDAYAIWLKNSQETLREMGSLPPPPASLLQFNIDAKDRLKDLRAQKSLSTIGPSTEEVRDYFRREEYLRYSIPDRAFTYTAADGKKSTVAPLRRGGGKPSAKVRDHFMLKSDRPPHVTILCLVRDAAARLPGGIGTRADVCTLIRDSQYISEDVTDNQVTQILSGALDRLHYEQDPCVRFEQERKLWVYLHRDRDEEDFDEDGTLSTKKWKKKKEPTNQATDVVLDEEQQTVNVVADAPQLDITTYQSMDVDHNIIQIVRDESEFKGAL